MKDKDLDNKIELNSTDKADVLFNKPIKLQETSPCTADEMVQAIFGGHLCPFCGKLSAMSMGHFECLEKANEFMHDVAHELNRRDNE